MKNKKKTPPLMNNNSFEKFSREITPEESAEVQQHIEEILAQPEKRKRAKAPSKKR
jgi:hypothetical protein